VHLFTGRREQALADLERYRELGGDTAGLAPPLRGLIETQGAVTSTDEAVTSTD
jgi:hypothetical protein